MAFILLVEDNMANMILARDLLEHGDHIVHCCTQAEEAIETLAELVPDLILLDIQLPRMDGYQLAEHIRKIEALAGVPIIGLSALAMANDKEKAIASGMSGYITKPINTRSFVGEIDHFLQQKP